MTDEMTTVPAESANAGNKNSDFGLIALGVLFILALVASIVFIITNSVVAGGIGVVCGLWATLMGLFLVVRYRTDWLSEKKKLNEKQKEHEAALQAEKDNHRRRELLLEQSYSEALIRQHSEALDDIRAQLDQMRATLVMLTGREWVDDPSAIPAHVDRIAEISGRPGTEDRDTDKETVTVADEPEESVEVSDSDERTFKPTAPLDPIESSVQEVATESDDGLVVEEEEEDSAASPDTIDEEVTVDHGDSDDDDELSVLKKRAEKHRREEEARRAAADEGRVARQRALFLAQQETQRQEHERLRAAAADNAAGGRHGRRGEAITSFDTGRFTAVDWEPPTSGGSHHHSDSSPVDADDDVTSARHGRHGGRRRADERSGSLSVLELLARAAEENND